MDVVAVVDLVCSLLAGPLKKLFICIHSEIKNRLSFQSHFDEVDLQLKDLIKRRDDVNQDLEAAARERLVPRDHVQDWLSKVDKIEAEVAAMKEGIQERFCDDTHCCYFNCRNRENIRQSILEKLATTKGLAEDGKFPEGVAAPVRVEHIPGPSIEHQSTAAKNIARVMDLLNNDDVKRIGMWGMGGAGKTTLVNNINNKLKDASLLKERFSVVIWVAVSNKFEEALNLKRVQKQIADRLNIKLDANEEDTQRIAIQLHERLKKERFLLILDDVWHPINLDTIGIPRPENDCEGVKILLTTRFLGVCRAMNTEIFEVEVLNQQESWDLFCESAGEVATSEGIEPLAKEVTKECCGLPLAIIVVGASMSRKYNIKLWEDALNTLSSGFGPVDIPIESKVFNPLKWSFDSLRDKQIKSCFLFCCLYPEDHLIDVHELIWYWLAEGLLDDRLDLEQVRNRGITVIECLKDHCLLEEGHKKDTVKMHDIVRDVAIWIATSPNEEDKSVVRSVVQSGLGLRRIPKEKNFESAKRLSFMFNKLNMLPESVNACPLASTLLLQGNDSLGSIPDMFLQALLSLKVLDLSGCSIKSLPLSLGQLVQLQALILAQCKYLEEIPSVGELGKLQLLSCRGTNIKALPQGMERLTSLRQLDLSQITSSTAIQVGAIAALSNLEALSMSRSTGKWDMQGNVGEGPCLLEEILSLEQLIFCDIVLESIPCNVSSGDALFPQMKKLKAFTLYIGSISIFDDDSKRPVILSGLNFSEESIGWLFSNATFVQLFRCEGLDQMFQKIAMDSVGSFDALCRLDIAHSQSSFDELPANLDMQFDLLPNLETIYLRDLTRITSISRLAEHLGLKFHKLRCIRIERCPKLKYLLSMGGSILQLGQLKEISVDSCEEMEELFSYNFPSSRQTFSPDFAFPNIQITSLRNLPKLLSFCRESIGRWPHMEKLEVNNCHLLKRVSVGPQNT